MASWNDSFDASLNVVVYSVGWWIVGGIIAYIGFGMYDRRPDSVIPTLIIIFGLGTGFFGTGASFFKVFAEFLKKELKQEIMQNELLKTEIEPKKEIKEDFNCANCGEPIPTDYWIINSKKYCTVCHDKLIGVKTERKDKILFYPQNPEEPKILYEKLAKVDSTPLTPIEIKKVLEPDKGQKKINWGTYLIVLLCLISVILFSLYIISKMR